MKTEFTVCVLDSGIGGLPYLQAIQEALPNQSLIYLSDSQFFPYGEKEPQELRDRLRELLQWVLQSYSVRVCVVACNTASVVALDFLRESFPFVTFVGVVPAVKPAVSMGLSPVVVLATRRTVEDPYLDSLVQLFAHDVDVVPIGAGELVEFIEHQLYKPSDPRVLLQPIAKKIQDVGAKVVVLGCTHFLHISTELADALGNTIEVVDSRDGVARQTARVCRKIYSDNSTLDSQQRADHITWYSTGEKPGKEQMHVHQSIAKHFHLQPEWVKI